MAVTRSVFIGKEIEENIYFVFGRESEGIDSLIDVNVKFTETLTIITNISVILSIKVFLL